MAEELKISTDGRRLWSGKEWISVKNVSLKVLQDKQGVQLSPDDNFWWNHVTQSWERVSDAPASATPPSGPPSGPNPVTTTTPQLEEPPTVEEMREGAAVLSGSLNGIVTPVHELAEKILKLGGTPEIVMKLVENTADGFHALELLGIESAVVFGGATLATIIVPLGMWLEGLEDAVNAGRLERIRWEIYKPWMHGYISGLYNQETGGNEDPFKPWYQQGKDITSGLDANGKRGLTGDLIAAYVYNTSKTETVLDRLTHEQWDRRIDWRHAYSGLEIKLSEYNI
jgi:hypothetical protein